MRRIAAGVLAVLLLAAMVMPAWAETTDNGDLIVYCTLTGDCYHRDGCGSLRSRIEIRIADAVARGLAPCKHCNPPIYTGAPVPASPDRTSSAPSTRSVSGGTWVEVVHGTRETQSSTSEPVVPVAQKRKTMSSPVEIDGAAAKPSVWDKVDEMIPIIVIVILGGPYAVVLIHIGFDTIREKIKRRREGAKP